MTRQAMIRQTMTGHHPTGRGLTCQSLTCQDMVCHNMVRRLALGSPYSKPSTAEDGLRHPASGRASPVYTQPV